MKRYIVGVHKKEDIYTLMGLEDIMCGLYL
jgi:hypothetical protein